MTQSYQQQSFIIANILYLYSSKKNEIKNYYSNIHNAFYQLKLKHPTFFDRLFFDTNGHLPYSKDLNDIIQDFQVSGLVNKLNPGFNTLIINKKETENLIRKSSNDFPEMSTEELNSLVDELAL